MYTLMWLQKNCPDYWAGLEAYGYDAACIARKHVEAKVRDLPADSSARPMYEAIHALQFFVDNSHFRTHNKTDKFCRETTSPKLEANLKYTTDSNTEVRARSRPSGAPLAPLPIPPRASLAAPRRCASRPSPGYLASSGSSTTWASPRPPSSWRSSSGCTTGASSASAAGGVEAAALWSRAATRRWA